MTLMTRDRGLGAYRTGTLEVESSPAAGKALATFVTVRGFAAFFFAAVVVVTAVVVVGVVVVVTGGAVVVVGGGPVSARDGSAPTVANPAAETTRSASANRLFTP